MELWLRRHLARYIWVYAVSASLVAHFFVYGLPYLSALLQSEPEPIKVPINVRVVDKSTPVRKGDLEGSFKPPEPEKKEPKPVAQKPKPATKSKKASVAPPAKDAETEQANTLPGQKEIIGKNDKDFGSPDGTLDGVVAIQGQADLSADAQLITSSVIIPEYTDGALDAGFEGLVIVEVYVNEKGDVTDAEMPRKVGYGMDRRILESARRAKFIPRKNSKGQALATWTEIPFRFVIP